MLACSHWPSESFFRFLCAVDIILILFFSTVEVLATLTGDVGRILSKLHLVQPNGNVNLVTGIRIAHVSLKTSSFLKINLETNFYFQLVLKHRQGKNHKMRIVLFIGSPLVADEGEIVKLAKRLKKEKVNVDIVSFGDHQKNSDLLTAFINALNGKDGTGSHLVSVPRGSQLQEALISSPIIQGKLENTKKFELKLIILSCRRRWIRWCRTWRSWI